MKGNVLKGHLEMLVLSVLARQPRHGYAIIEDLRVWSDDAFELPEGTLYPVLHRLEKSGLISGSWDDVDGRRRKSYALTDGGHAALDEQRRSWHEFSVAVESVIGGVPWPSR
ncbi:PadR family transcriptional regulator [Mumia zhuanghuii]|uniref:PadR family transcriptional regulator n=2 Tax=Mumia TaxID=1546255 RepID=A0ABW1QIE6_9ACTN|nr:MULTISPECIES: helix-turn-helix transcriptional regulator [Mumia]KAA1424744.1 PadR family transcriptional regulator [Mumia zhuanghuii]